jgi:hypothetical protein
MLNPKDIGANEEQYEFFERKQAGRTKQYCQYDYRNENGELFSTIRLTLEECRQARDKWQEIKQTAKGE